MIEILVTAAILICMTTAAITFVIYFASNHFLRRIEIVRARDAARMNEVAGILTKSLGEHAKTITQYHEQLTTSHGYLKQALSNEEQHLRSLELMRQYVEEKIGDVDTTLNNGELIRTGGNQYSFKRRRT